MTEHPLFENDRYVSLSPAAGSTDLQFDFQLFREDALKIVLTRNGEISTLERGLDWILPLGLGNEFGGTAQLVMPAQEGDRYELIGLEPVERESDFLQSNGFSTEKINRDLNKLARVNVELWRELQRSVRLPFGFLEPLVEAPQDGAGLMWGVDGTRVRIKNGPNLVAEAAAWRAADDALRSLIGQGGPAEVTFFDSRLAVTFASIKGTLSSLLAGGYAAAGDGGGGLYHRVASEPAHDGKVRSADRFLPGGVTDEANGGWWELSARVVTAAMFGVLGTDDTQAYRSAAAYAVAKSALFDGLGKELLISDTLTVDSHFRARSIKLRAIGAYWEDNDADPDADLVGKPVVICSEDEGVDIDGFELDCGLTAIDPVNQDKAAAGVLFNNNSLQHNWRNVHIAHYNGYGYWTRGKHTDSLHDRINLQQWKWGEKGWFDVAARTAYGWVNTTGDFFASHVVANYNKSNIHVLDGAFTTQWSKIHPYNGSDEAATLPNITVHGGAGQQFDEVYLDNGGIVLKTFEHQFSGIRTVRGATTSGQYPVFTLIASVPAEDGLGLSIDRVMVTVNDLFLYQTEGTGSWRAKKAHVVQNIFRRAPKVDGRVSHSTIPDWGIEIVQSPDPKDVRFRVNNTDGNMPSLGVANRTAALEVFGSGFAGSVNLLNVSSDANHYPSIRSAKAKGEFYVTQPSLGEVLFELWATATNGLNFGTGAQPYNGGGGLRVAANQNWSPTAMGANLEFYITPLDAATRALSYGMTGEAFMPYPDNSRKLGRAANRWSEIFAANATINTSDERMKTEIEDIPDDVLDAWAEVPKRRYKWKDAFAEKGDSARWHVGVIAQDVVAAFERHGLDAHRYSVLCLDEWPEQTIHHAAESVPVLNDAGDPVMVEKRDADGNVVMQLQTVEQVDDAGVVTLMKAERPVLEPKMETVQEAWDEVLPAGSRYGIRYSEAQQLDTALERRERAALMRRIEQMEAASK